jgi:hypothetical protein
MARGEPYSPEDDAILLAHRSTADIQEALAAAGRPERTASAIRERKRMLTASVNVEALAEERQKIVTELADIDRRRTVLYNRLTELTIAIVADALGVRPEELPPNVLREVQEQAEKLTQQ